MGVSGYNVGFFSGFSGGGHVYCSCVFSWVFVCFPRGGQGVSCGFQDVSCVFEGFQGVLMGV